MIKVLIVDDHELLRAGLELIFETASDIDVIGTADDGQEGLDTVSYTHLTLPTICSV